MKTHNHLNMHLVIVSVVHHFRLLISRLEI